MASKHSPHSPESVKKGTPRTQPAAACASLCAPNRWITHLEPVNCSEEIVNGLGEGDFVGSTVLPVEDQWTKHEIEHGIMHEFDTLLDIVLRGAEVDDFTFETLQLADGAPRLSLTYIVFPCLVLPCLALPYLQA